MSEKDLICVNDICLIKDISDGDRFADYKDSFRNRMVRVVQVKAARPGFVMGQFKLQEKIEGFKTSGDIISFEKGVHLEKLGHDMRHTYTELIGGWAVNFDLDGTAYANANKGLEAKQLIPKEELIQRMEEKGYRHINFETKSDTLYFCQKPESCAYQA